jgi:hypothetical protein
LEDAQEEQRQDRQDEGKLDEALASFETRRLACPST